jgi:rubrerythrin
LVAAILAAIAVGLIPGQQAIKDGDTDRYDSWGKGAIYFLAFVLLALGGYIAYIWYSGGEEGLFDTSEVIGILHTSNMVLFMVLGIGLIANNAYVSKAISARSTELDEEATVVEILDAEAVEVKPKKMKTVKKKAPTKKKVKKAVVTRKPKPKKVVKKKPKKKAPVKTVKKPKKVIKKPKPAKAASEELIEDGPEPSQKALTCPSCDTPVDHSHDSCPICGEDLKG